ncbi:helix-turn-helix domain-containing protein [Rhodopseudomonas palustris]|uniref:helix-turn-helix domain-containing protein n=1 Tax=Rhodopseudomonas palustris TaxID=1076 RepID=UPI001401F079|nr:helix-turn-helix domain-containing protein [Rhodopseudomonas palustris]QLH71669.1 helix-turn-helix domain-containing protein [Rhodopseudomonas palustris]
MFDVAADPDEIGRFEGNFACYSTNRFVLTNLQASRVRLVRSNATIEHDQLDHFAVTFFAAGGATAGAEHISIDTSQGDVVFTDLSRTVTLQLAILQSISEAITLWIPRYRFQGSISTENDLHGIVLKGDTAAGRMLGYCLQCLSDQTHSLTSDHFDSLADGLIELAANAVRTIPQAQLAPRVGRPLASFVTIRRYIERNLASPFLDANFIAVNFGLSRSSVYRLFEPVGGIASYIRKARLQKTWVEIVTPELADQRIAQIAHRYGFSNLGTFNRLFRNAYGISPGDARKNAKMKGYMQPFRSQAIGSSCLAAHLRRIAELR